MRKPNYAEQIRILKNEIDTVEKFMAPKLRQVEELDAINKQRPLTKSEHKQVAELISYIHEKNVWLAKAKNQLKAYYMPVSA
jgi:hypothetical protein